MLDGFSKPFFFRSFGFNAPPSNVFLGARRTFRCESKRAWARRRPTWQHCAEALRIDATWDDGDHPKTWTVSCIDHVSLEWCGFLYIIPLCYRMLCGLSLTIQIPKTERSTRDRYYQDIGSRFFVVHLGIEGNFFVHFIWISDDFSIIIQLKNFDGHKHHFNAPKWFFAPKEFPKTSHKSNDKSLCNFLRLLFGCYL